MTSKELLPAYLIVGADEYRRSTVVGRMKSRLEQTGMMDFNLDERDMTRDPQIDDIIASLNTLPMGSDFRLVILYGCDRLPKSVVEPLVEYLSHPSPSTVCLIVAERLAKNTRLYKAASKVGPKALIDCSPKSLRELPSYVAKMARQRGGSITPAAAEELVGRVGENTRLLDSEIKKLFEIAQVQTIEKDHVERYVVRTAEVKPWDLLNAISARDMNATLEQLSLQPAKSEVRLFSLIVGRIRELIVAKALDARGDGRRLAETLGLQGWQVRNHIMWSRRYAMGELARALHDAVEVEMALKGSRDSELALRLWVTGLIDRPGV